MSTDEYVYCGSPDHPSVVWVPFPGDFYVTANAVVSLEGESFPDFVWLSAGHAEDTVHF